MKYTKEKLEEAAKVSLSVAAVIKSLGGRSFNGGVHSHVSKLIKKYGIDTSHFLGQRANSGKRHCGGRGARPAKDILSIRSEDNGKEKTEALRRALSSIGREYKCEGCGLVHEWCGNKLVLEIDHINSTPLDNRPENLRFLCPNCHSQTRGYNRRKDYVFPVIKEGPPVLSPIAPPVKAKRIVQPKYHPCIDCGKPATKGATRCKSCSCIKKMEAIRKRPPFSVLISFLNSNGHNFLATGRHFGVSDNAIRKWLALYEKNPRLKDVPS